MDTLIMVFGLAIPILLIKVIKDSFTQSFARKLLFGFIFPPYGFIKFIKSKGKQEITEYERKHLFKVSYLSFFIVYSPLILIYTFEKMKNMELVFLLLILLFIPPIIYVYYKNNNLKKVIEKKEDENRDGENEIDIHFLKENILNVPFIFSSHIPALLFLSYYFYTYSNSFNAGTIGIIIAIIALGCLLFEVNDLSPFD